MIPATLDLPSLEDVSASVITPELTQGSRPPIGGFLAAHGYGAVVLAAMEYQPARSLFPGVVVIRAPIDDNFLVPPSDREMALVERASSEAALMALTGRRVYVSCYMGHNRSGFVMGLTLHKMTGMSGTKIVDHIRSRRPHALGNPWFRSCLERLPAVAGRARRRKKPR